MKHKNILLILALVGAAFVALFVALSNRPNEMPALPALTPTLVDDSQSSGARTEQSDPKTDAQTYRILAAKEEPCGEDAWGEKVFQEILQVKISEDWKEVYRTPNPIEKDGSCSKWPIRIYKKDIKLSPLSDYIEFSIIGGEKGRKTIFNVKTGKEILALDTNPDEFIYSQDGKNYTFRSYQEQLGGSGRNAIWVSKFNQPDEPVLIFDLENWTKVPSGQIYWQLYGLDKLIFIDNQTIQFSVFEKNNQGEMTKEIAQYRYNLEKEKLTKPFRK